MEPFATVDQLAERMATTFTDPEQARAGHVLDHASALIRTVANVDWVDESGALDDAPAIITSTTLAVAQRAMENPRGANQVASGDASVSYGRTEASVYLTDGERADVRRAAAKHNERSSFGVLTLSSPLTGLTTYIDVDGQSEPMPYL